VNFPVVGVIVSIANNDQEKRIFPGISHIALRAPRNDTLIIEVQTKIIIKCDFWGSPHETVETWVGVDFSIEIPVFLWESWVLGSYWL
jgi:hypothetical protein